MSKLIAKLDAWYDRQPFDILVLWAIMFFVLAHIVAIAIGMGLGLLLHTLPLGGDL